MSEREVVDLMTSSQTEREWNANRDSVLAKFGGYPTFWQSAIVDSGVFDEAFKRFWFYIDEPVAEFVEEEPIVIVQEVPVGRLFVYDGSSIAIVEITEVHVIVIR